MLADALIAQGKPIEAARDAFRRAEARSEHTRSLDILRAKLLAIAGDFDAALVEARRIGADPSALPFERLQAVNFALDVLEESGRAAEAHVEREAAIRASAAWSQDLQVQTFAAQIEVMLAHNAWISKRVDRDAYVRVRDAADARIRALTNHESVWFLGDAYGARPMTKEDATDLLKVPAAAKPGEFDMAVVGEARLVTGDVPGAVSALGVALRPCQSIFRGIEPIRLRALLGAALEQAGDMAGAVREYERVLQAWGAAKPRSVTAERIRPRLAKLRPVPPAGPR
jgi:serine/threonine-protein kinase